MVYWLVSVPYEGTSESDSSKTFKFIKDTLQHQQRVCECIEFKVPKLKVGTVDQLLQLSDDFNKYDSNCEQITMKALKTLADVSELTESSDFVPEVILKEDTSVPVQTYLDFFQWDDSQFLINKPIREIADSIHKKTTKLDEELRFKISEYTNLKQNVQQLERKTSGNLTVRTLDGIIKKEHVLETEYLTTVFVVVSKSSIKEWEQNYENLTDMVVPDSSELIYEDNDSALFNVVVLKKIADDFKSACLKRKFVVREFTYDEDKANLSHMEKEEMDEKLKNTKKELVDWCQMVFSECFTAWIHLKVLRVYVESILRYGLPPCYTVTLLKIKRNEKKVHKFFKEHYGHLEEQMYGMGGQENSSVDLAGMGSAAMMLNNYGMEWAPYVLITINTSNPFLKLE
ncbi:hypothetical protein FDP41_004828 [Naegleria fowleri]|uniref:V-type proton ATPase subunit C n=1 Tax=Naegleria fowleri TaxID=5763 RepID=A0A6A5BE67_NAEFO|nr:uncharacterized protein FDP41_004828 [Naegleria fowleri]KAF0976153.1 hypothetical protein FDP41_004828 [Naegleria fowleri]